MNSPKLMQHFPHQLHSNFAMRISSFSADMDYKMYGIVVPVPYPAPSARGPGIARLQEAQCVPSFPEEPVVPPLPPPYDIGHHAEQGSPDAHEEDIAGDYHGGLYCHSHNDDERVHRLYSRRDRAAFPIFRTVHAGCSFTKNCIFVSARSNV
jgi:hypothetical protein